jgi:hypothetical protein
MIDDYSNTLLHIAVLTNNKQFVRELIHMGINKDKKNKFGKLALDMAIEQNFIEIIKIILFDNRYYDQHYNVILSKNKTLKNNIKILEAANDKLVTSNGKWENNNLQLNNMLTSEKRGTKRLRDDNNNYSDTIMALREDVIKRKLNNIKLINENASLINDNNILKKTVDNLRETEKKK